MRLPPLDFMLARRLLVTRHDLSTEGDVMLLKKMADCGETFTPVNGSRERLAHARPFCYTARQTIQQRCVRRMVARVKPQNSSARATIRWMRPMGASPFVVSCKAFAGLTLKPRERDCALLFSLGFRNEERRRRNRWHQT